MLKLKGVWENLKGFKVLFFCFCDFLLEKLKKIEWVREILVNERRWSFSLCGLMREISFF